MSKFTHYTKLNITTFIGNFFMWKWTNCLFVKQQLSLKKMRKQRIKITKNIQKNSKKKLTSWRKESYKYFWGIVRLGTVKARNIPKRFPSAWPTVLIWVKFDIANSLISESHSFRKAWTMLEPSFYFINILFFFIYLFYKEKELFENKKQTETHWHTHT